MSRDEQQGKLVEAGITLIKAMGILDGGGSIEDVALDVERGVQEQQSSGQTVFLPLRGVNDLLPLGVKILEEEPNMGRAKVHLPRGMKIVPDQGHSMWSDIQLDDRVVGWVFNKGWFCLDENFVEVRGGGGE